MMIYHFYCQIISLSKIIIHYAILLFFIVGLLLTINACVIDKNQQVPIIDGWLDSKTDDQYRVKDGDTLYSIAWDFGLDYRILAEINHLTPPYAVAPGQIINMNTQLQSESTHWASQEEVVSVSTPHQSSLINIASAPPPEYKPSVYQPTTINSHSSPDIQPHVMASSEGKASKIPKSENFTSYQVAEKNSIEKKTNLSFATFSGSSYISHWLWPTQGKVIEGYSTALAGNHGLNIGGVLDQTIHASAAGEIVYSGTGVRGYGNLIIIKHNVSFLSAYAYNQRILVKLGQKVRAGQQIATMGRGENGRVMLHFEIRRNGQPVNPLWFLR